jgi:hypothetical protein
MQPGVGVRHAGPSQSCPSALFSTVQLVHRVLHLIVRGHHRPHRRRAVLHGVRQLLERGRTVVTGRWFLVVRRNRARRCRRLVRSSRVKRPARRKTGVRCGKMLPARQQSIANCGKIVAQRQRGGAACVRAGVSGRRGVRSCSGSSVRCTRSSDRCEMNRPQRCWSVVDCFCFQRFPHG